MKLSQQKSIPVPDLIDENGSRGGPVFYSEICSYSVQLPFW